MKNSMLILAVFALCLTHNVLSSNMRGSTDRELASKVIASNIPLGNLGTLIGNLIHAIDNNSTSANTTKPAGSTTPAANSSVSDNSTSSTVPVVNNTVPVNNTPAPVSNTTTPSVPVVNNTSAPASNTTPSTPVVNNTNSNDGSSVPANTSNSVPPVSSNPTDPVSNTTTPSAPAANNTDSTPSSNATTTTPVTPVTPATPNWYARNDVDMNAFPNKCLVIHNILRSAVGVAPLTWSDSLAASAQAWAENMAVNGFRHSGRTGENIASTTSSKKVLDSLLDLWTREQNWFIKGCKYPHCSSSSAEVGHYTQMVWAHTTQVGCGFAPGVNKGWNYLCCQYYKAGNVIGQSVYPYPIPTAANSTTGN